MGTPKKGWFTGSPFNENDKFMVHFLDIRSSIGSLNQIQRFHLPWGITRSSREPVAKVGSSQVPF